LSSPITVFGGEWKSATEVPSRRNSGFMQTPKSVPAFRPDSRSMIGIRWSSTVPGMTVLRITMVGKSVRPRIPWPICSQTRRT
jgi:hypothetical protein